MAARGSGSTVVNALAARKKPPAASQVDYSKWTFQPLDPRTGQAVPSANIETDPGRVLPVSTAAQLPQFRGIDQSVGRPQFVETDPGRVLPQSVYQQLPQFKPVAKPQFTPAQNVAPNIITQDEHTFATATANQAMADMRAQGATPLVEDFKKSYQDALDKSLTQQQQILQQKMELSKQSQLQQSQSALELQRSRQLAQEAEQREYTKAAWEAAGKPVNVQGQPVAVGTSGAKPTTALPDAEADKALGYINGLNAIQQIGKSFMTMKQNTAGAFQGGVGGRVLGVAGAMTSPEEIQFNADVDNNLVPLAKGLQGDTGATAGKDVIRASLHESLPNVLDSPQVGMGKVYATTQQQINNLIQQRDMFKGHYDTSALDAAIEKNQQYLINNATYAPTAYKDQPVVQSGLSGEAQATIDKVNNQLNTSANAGIPPPQATTPSPGQMAVQQGAAAGAKAGAVAAGATAGAQAGAQQGAQVAAAANPNMQPLTAQSVGNTPAPPGYDPNKFLSGSD